VIGHYVEAAIEQICGSHVTRVGMDETSARKRHDYVTLFFDLEQRRLLEVAYGKDHRTVKSFAESLEQHGGLAKEVREVSGDLSPAFQKGVRERLPQAGVTFDRFHLLRISRDEARGIMERAVARGLGRREADIMAYLGVKDAVRSLAQEGRRDLKGLRQALLFGEENLPERHEASISALKASDPRKTKGYALKENLRCCGDHRWNARPGSTSYPGFAGLSAVACGPSRR
jgi:transposase